MVRCTTRCLRNWPQVRRGSGVVGERDRHRSRRSNAGVQHSSLRIWYIENARHHQRAQRIKPTIGQHRSQRLPVAAGHHRINTLQPWQHDSDGVVGRGLQCHLDLTFSSTRESLLRPTTCRRPAVHLASSDLRRQRLVTVKDAGRISPEPHQHERDDARGTCVRDERAGRVGVRPIRWRECRRQYGDCAVGPNTPQRIVESLEPRRPVPLGESGQPPFEPIRADIDGAGVGHLPSMPPRSTVADANGHRAALRPARSSLAPR